MRVRQPKRKLFAFSYSFLVSIRVIHEIRVKHIMSKSVCGYAVVYRVGSGFPWPPVSLVREKAATGCLFIR